MSKKEKRKDSSNKSPEVRKQSLALDPRDDRVIQSEIVLIRKDLEGEANLIEYMQKLWRRRQGTTKVVLNKREEFFQKKHRKVI